MPRIDPPLHAGPHRAPADLPSGPASPSHARDEAHPPREPAPKGAPGAVSTGGVSSGGVSSGGGGLTAEAGAAVSEGVAAVAGKGAGALWRRLLWRATRVGLAVTLGLTSAGIAAIAAFSVLA